jgi:hypothetical protein
VQLKALEKPKLLCDELIGEFFLEKHVSHLKLSGVTAAFRIA